MTAHPRRLPVLLPEPRSPAADLRALVREEPGIRCCDAFRRIDYRSRRLPAGVVGVRSRVDCALRLFPPQRQVYGTGPVVVADGLGREARGASLGEALALFEVRA